MVSFPNKKEPSAKLVYRNLLPPLLRSDDTVVEVGALFGGTTLLLAQNVKQVHAFEANPPSFKWLQMYTKPYKNIKVYQEGVSDKTGHEFFNLTGHPFSVFASFTKNMSAPNPYTRTLIVKTRALDDFDVSASVLLLDCEGGEIKVLLGGKKFLSKARLVIVEIHETPTGSTLGRVKEILTDAGFDCSEKTLSLEETLRIVPKNDPDVTWKSELKNKTQTWIVAERVS